MYDNLCFIFSEEIISSDNFEGSVEVEEASQLVPETSHDLDTTLQGPVSETIVKGTSEDRKQQTVETLLMQKLLKENRRLLMKVNELQGKLEKYEKREKAWVKRRNVLKCRLQRREKILANLKPLVAIFQEDTKSDGEHASFALKKLKGLPHEILENEMKNRERNACGCRSNTKMKEFALTLYYSPAA